MKDRKYIDTSGSICIDGKCTPISYSYLNDFNGEYYNYLVANNKVTITKFTGIDGIGDVELTIELDMGRGIKLMKLLENRDEPLSEMGKELFNKFFEEQNPNFKENAKI